MPQEAKVHPTPDDLEVYEQKYSIEQESLHFAYEGVEETPVEESQKTLAENDTTHASETNSALQPPDSGTEKEGTGGAKWDQLPPTSAMETAEQTAKEQQQKMMAMGAKSDPIRQFLITGPDEKTPLNMWRYKVALFMDGIVIRSLFSAIIILNGIIVGVEADYGNDSPVWFYLEVFFLIAFTIELIGKVTGFGWFLFFKDNWNILDFLVVVTSSIDFVVGLMTGTESSGLTIIRLMRILRIIKITNKLEQLSAIVSAFVMAMRSVIWVILLMILALYVFAIMCKTLIGDSAAIQEDVSLDLNLFFGSIPRTMVTLLQLVANDSSYSGIMRQLGEARPAAWILFVTFTIVVSVGVMELLTAVFIESLLEEKKRLEMVKNQDTKEARNHVEKMIVDLFAVFDEDGSQALDPRELGRAEEFLCAKENEGLLEGLGITPAILRSALRVADLDMDGVVTCAELESALDSVHKEVKMKDIREVHMRISDSSRKLAAKIDETKDEIFNFIKMTYAESKKEILDAINVMNAQREALDDGTKVYELRPLQVPH